jgi:toxin HigB-1
VVRNAQQLVHAVSFRQKGLRKYFESGSLAGIEPAHSKRLQMQLAALETSQTVQDMNVPWLSVARTKRG